MRNIFAGSNTEHQWSCSYSYHVRGPVSLLAFQPESFLTAKIGWWPRDFESIVKHVSGGLHLCRLAKATNNLLIKAFKLIDFWKKRFKGYFFLSTNFCVEILEFCGPRRSIDCEDFFSAPFPFLCGRSRCGFSESFYFALRTLRPFEGFVRAFFCGRFVGAGNSIFGESKQSKSLLLGALQTKALESEPTFKFLFSLSLDWCLIVLLRTIFQREIFSLEE